MDKPNGLFATISIPAPARGATNGDWILQYTEDISIPAPARGAKGCCPSPSSPPCYFNSRPRERGDLYTFITPRQIGISIPAPARGATEKQARRAMMQVFQFPPLREGRRMICLCPIASTAFQFPPLREGRPAVDKAVQVAGDFNSRPCERGDTTLSAWNRCS